MMLQMKKSNDKLSNNDLSSIDNQSQFNTVSSNKDFNYQNKGNTQSETRSNRFSIKNVRNSILKLNSKLTMNKPSKTYDLKKSASKQN